VKAIGTLSRVSLVGANSFRFTGRVNGKRLAPGKYRLKASAVGGKAISKRFTIAR
jgi:hypothetical protein